MKKYFAVLLCIGLLASMLAFTASAENIPNVALDIDKTEVAVGDTVTVTITNKEMTILGFGCYLEFDKDLLECTEITGTDGDEYLGLYKTSGKSPWVDATVGDTVEETNSDGIFSFGVLAGANDAQFAEGIVATLTFTAVAEGRLSMTLTERTSGTDSFDGMAAANGIIINTTDAPGDKTTLVMVGAFVALISLAAVVVTKKKGYLR
ncbi:MAG: hypothetical protein E7616_05140 [Ruminococcaceae bacterium]|nr:hypothetical protein [Oscillospiraceae bacterium]